MRWGILRLFSLNLRTRFYVGRCTTGMASDRSFVFMYQTPFAYINLYNIELLLLVCGRMLDTYEIICLRLNGIIHHKDAVIRNTTIHCGP